MKNFVISLQTSIERRAHIQHQFNERKIDFEFFDAIYPAINQHIANQLGVDIEGCNLTEGEISCLLSHISLWQRAVNEHIDFIAIYEDDIILGHAISKFLNDSDWIPKQSQVIKLEKFYNRAYMRFKRTSIPYGRHLRQLTGMHLGAAGYILKRDAAQFLLQHVQSQEVPVAVDHILFEDMVLNRQLMVEQMIPSLCIQSDRLHPPEKAITSVLERDRRKRIDAQMVELKKIKRPISYKIKRELIRIMKQIALILSKQSFK